MFRFFYLLSIFFDHIGKYLSLLIIRIMPAWHFWDSGIAGFHREMTEPGVHNIFPFSLFPSGSGALIVMWIELLASFLLFIGFAGRFAASALLVVSITVLYSYAPVELSPFADFWRGLGMENATALNIKLYLAFTIMLTAVVLSGPGRISLDALVKLYFHRFCSCSRRNKTAKEIKARPEYKDLTKDDAKKPDK